MSSGLRGIELSRFEDGQTDVRLIAQFDAERNPSLLDLKATQVWSEGGTFRELANLAEVRFRDALERIKRIDGRTALQVRGKRADDVTSGEMSDLLTAVMATVALPRGYSWSEASYSGEISAQLEELGRAGLLAITLVFMLMGILFESVVLPGAILVTVPFAILGSLLSLWLFYGSIDVMAGIGVLLLAGIVVNNGIVLLDCIARLRRQGRSRMYAIMRGTRTRTRPIFMTATTTVVGLLPMAVFGESSGQGFSYVSMSIAVSGGLIVSTVFTVLTVPIAYTFLDDGKRLARGLLRRLRRRPIVISSSINVKPQSL